MKLIMTLISYLLPTMSRKVWWSRVYVRVYSQRLGRN